MTRNEIVYARTRAFLAACCRVFAASTLCALASCRANPPVDRPLAIQPLALGVGDVSLAPQLSVTGERAIVSWIDTGGTTTTLKFAERTGNGWSDPRAVASGNDWFINWADVPSVVRLADGTLAAHWLKEVDPAAEAYDVNIAFSKDDGRTWSAPVSPHHDGTKTQHGFATLFQAPGAGLGLIWLDGRAVDEAAGHDSMGLRAATFDRDGKEIAESLVDERVCDCCPTAAALTSDGPIAAFRDRSADEIRDVSVSRLVDGRWTAPASVHDDHWQIEACPVNGPAISAHNRDVVVAWMTAKEEDGMAFAAFSGDGGATFGAPVRLDDAGSLGRVGVVLLEDGSAMASWVEFADSRAGLKIRRIDRSGHRGAAQSVAGVGAGRTSGQPRLARHGGELLLAWLETSDGRSTVRTAVAGLPSR
jgi:hypothetical protein